VANKYPNVIPLEDTPQILNTAPPGGKTIFCRFKATFFCLEENILQSKYRNQDEVRACVGETMDRLRQLRNQSCI
jgi:hypothetical protein